VTSIQTFKTGIKFKTEAEERQFSRLCTVIADAFLPFLARCFSAIYHSNQFLIDISIGDLIVTVRSFFGSTCEPNRCASANSRMPWTEIPQTS
jgi:hypothetical protein